jgi:polyhydroxyalkanoate synthesis regulator phasin
MRETAKKNSKNIIASSDFSKSLSDTERQDLVSKLTKTYQIAQQIQYLYLQAEIEVLLQQLHKIQIVSMTNEKSNTI